MAPHHGKLVVRGSTFCTHHNAGIGRVVADGVKHFAHHLGMTVKLLDA
jgi:hypothetical protein